MVNDSEAKPTSTRKFRLYLDRAGHWRCPVCGISPLFPPVNQVESISDWFAMLPGCPRCDYMYDREPGYFLLALWVINFGIVAIFGVSLMLGLDYFFPNLSTGQLIFFTLVPLWVLGILSVRHTKAYFLAIDHFINPIDHGE